MTQRLKCVKCGRSDMLHKMRRHDGEFNEMFMWCKCGTSYVMPYLVPRMAIPKRVDPRVPGQSQSEPRGIMDDPLWEELDKLGNVVH